MTDLLAKPKKKQKTEKPSATTLAFREYSRLSFCLALQGDFNLRLDLQARKFWEDALDGKTKTAQHIEGLISDRLDAAQLKSIPKGDHIDGLAVRTAEFERVYGKASEKQAVVKTPKAEKLAVTPNMRKLLKKKGATSVDEAGTLA